MSYQAAENGGFMLSPDEKIEPLNQPKRSHRSYVFSVIAAISFAVLTVLGISLSKPFSINLNKGSGAELSLAAAHAALNLQPDVLGRYKYHSLSEDGKKFLFGAFTNSYSKSYDDVEKDQRFESFKKSLQRVDERNAEAATSGSNIVHGLTKFSDLSEDEFKKRFLTATPPAEKKSFRNVAKPGKYIGSATAAMWDGVYTTKVRDQGYCGACWAFSAAQQIESDSIRLGLIDKNTLLSPQQLISCDNSGFGCDGGWTEKAYEYIQKAGGLSLDSQYKYTAYENNAERCQPKLIDGYVTVTGYGSIEGESDMINYVLSTGPLSVCIDSNGWDTYVSGIMAYCGNTPNHCVQVVGVDTVTDGGFWKVRNTWGPDWGEEGYIRLAVGKNMCAITHDPTFTYPALVNA